MKIVHIISGLAMGGAEMMLYKLLSLMDRSAFTSEVISLTDAGVVGPKLEALGIPVRALGMRQGVPDPLRVLTLGRWLRRSRPDVVQTWLYHADLIGGLAARMAGLEAIAWNIRHGPLDPAHTKRSTVLTAQACAVLSSRLPARIICCSEVSRRIHEARGYPPGKLVVIPNGFDLELWQPDPAARLAVRHELGLPDDALIIGLVGRFDPQKDHQTFVRAAGRLLEARPEVHFVLCGHRVTADNPALMGWIEATGRRDRFHLLGRREDTPRLTAAFDLATSSSASGEAFPNVVGEAMACGIPCVVTDIGDSAFIVGDTGRVVPPGDPRALAEAWLELIDAGPPARTALGQAARARVFAKFSLPEIVNHYQDFYQELASHVRHQRLS